MNLHKNVIVNFAFGQLEDGDGGRDDDSKCPALSGDARPFVNKK